MSSSRGSSQPRDGTSSLSWVRHWQVGSLPLVLPSKPRGMAYVYDWLIRVVWQKPTQHCKEIFFIKKKNTLKWDGSPSRYMYTYG